MTELETLGNKIRLGILSSLYAGSKTSTELKDILNFKNLADLTPHLTRLSDDKFIIRRRDGNYIYNKITEKGRKIAENLINEDLSFTFENNLKKYTQEERDE